jgi:hypothetical protein
MKNYGLTIASMFTASGNTMNQLDRSTFSLPGRSVQDNELTADARTGARVRSVCSSEFLRL